MELPPKEFIEGRGRMQVRLLDFYNESSPDNLNLEELKDYLKGKFKNQICISIKGNFSILYKSRVEKIARELAGIRIEDFKMKKNKSLQVDRSWVEMEKQMLEGDKVLDKNAIYDGFYLQEIYQRLFDEADVDKKNFPIIFSSRFFATWEEKDLRYHGRSCLLGYPSIISTTGIVEAPAKPREYYIKLGLYQRISFDENELKQEFKDRFIDYGDERLTEVAKGYLMQAIFYNFFGEVFCENNNCRLYNAHWQEELIRAQIRQKGEPDFCEKHQKMLDKTID